jgi:orotate phosphoribosyltransferase
MNSTEHTEEEMIKMFEEKGVVKRGHFKLTSGKHSDLYINKDSIMYYPDLFKMVVIEFTAMIVQYTSDCEVVTGPAVAGAVLAAPVSILSSKHFVYPEKIEDEPFAGDPSKWWKMVFRRGYDKGIQGKKLLIIEDIITTGGSVIKTIEAIISNGGYPNDVFCIWNRSGWTYPGIEVSSLINKKVDSWWPEECPLCTQGIELQDPKG